MEYPVCKLEACTYNELSKHTRIFNRNELDSALWIYLVPDVCRDLNIVELKEIVPATMSLVEESEVSRDRTCWIQLDITKLNLSSGQHVYKLLLEHKDTADKISLFFSYIIQDDNPDKSYVYMNKQCTGLCTEDCPCKSNNTN